MLQRDAKAALAAAFLANFFEGPIKKIWNILKYKKVYMNTEICNNSILYYQNISIENYIININFK